MLNYGIYLTSRHFHKFIFFLVPNVYLISLAWYIKQDAINLNYAEVSFL